MSAPTAATVPCPGADPCGVAHGLALLEAWKGFPLSISYSAGMDLTTHGLAFTVRHPVTGATIASATSASGGGITIIDAMNGKATWTISAASTAAAGWPAGQYPFEVALTDPSGAPPVGPSPLTWGKLLMRAPSG
jgi:hypothetical protein